MIQIEHRRWMKKRNKKRKTTNKTASIDSKEVNPEQNQLVAAIINSVQNSPLKEQPQSTQMIRYISNVNQTKAKKTKPTTITVMVTMVPLL